MAIIRSISGLRATFPDDLTAELLVKYCSAFSQLFPNGKIAIGRDGRPSGTWIEEICCKTLNDLGRSVVLLGVVPTPTVQLITEKDDSISCGIVVTASHNPSQWNGLKFINGEGTFIDAELNRKLWDIVDNFSTNNFTKLESKGEKIEYPDALRKHIDIIMEIPIFDDNMINAIRKRNLKVVVDAVNASGSKVVPTLLKDLGCEVVELYCDASGEFPHTPEPLPENLTELAKAVAQHKADIGVAVDPDADRLVLIDERGKPIGEERTICIAIDTVLSNYQKFGEYNKEVTVNLSTTMLAEYIANQYGATCTYSPVGEINVVNMMKSRKAVIGGEGSGGIILPKCHYGRDSLVGIALLLIHLTQNACSLSQAVDKFPKYEMLKTKMNFTGSIENIKDKIKEMFPSQEIDLQDGIKVTDRKSEDNQYWLQLRKSNTEPIIRIIAEGSDFNQITGLIEKVKGQIVE